ncbi:MAG: GcrA family cell cycle regulator [Pseudomonadota bacterium]
MTWTDERIQELGRLWEEGHSASYIGKCLGVTKNAVVGKAHRLKLAARPSPIKTGGAQPRRRRPVPVPRTMSQAVVQEAPRPAVEATPPPPPRPVVRRTRQRSGKGPSCLWPIGDPSHPDFHFCGADAVEGKPYCEEHCARAYITRTRPGQEAA